MVLLGHACVVFVARQDPELGRVEKDRTGIDAVAAVDAGIDRRWVRSASVSVNAVTPEVPLVIEMSRLDAAAPIIGPPRNTRLTSVVHADVLQQEAQRGADGNAVVALVL